jgi:hypothetical protein
MKRGLLLAAVLVLAGAGSASAAPLSYPGQESAATPLMGSLEKVAEEYWEGRNIALPMPVAVWRLPMETVGGEGELGGEQVWLRADLLDGLRSRGEAVRIYHRMGLCEIYLHERGHNAGLTHYAGFSIMDAQVPRHAPPRCEVWARHPWAHLGAK